MDAINDKISAIEHEITVKLSNSPEYMTSFEFGLLDDSNSCKTRLQYINHVIEFIKFQEQNKGYKLNDSQDLQQITRNDISIWRKNIAYYRKKGKMYPSSDATIAVKITAIKKFFDYYEELLNYNPTSGLSRPKIKKKEIITLDHNELNLILKNINKGTGSQRAKNYQKPLFNRDMAIIYLLVSTGIRIDSLVLIDVDDLNLSNRKVKITSKGSKSSIKGFNKDVAYYLSEYLDERLSKDIDNSALFLSIQKKRISAQAIQIMIKKYSIGIDKNITPHVFRKTFGTQLYKKTGDIKLVADMLDHTNIQTTTDNYVDKDIEKIEEASNYKFI